MFYERLKLLCEQKGITVTKLFSELKLSSSMMTRWKAGEGITALTLKKITNYFNISADYLIGNTEDTTVKDIDSELKGVDFALSGEIKNLSKSEKEDILAYIRFRKSQKK